jgi:hypothetical protein
MHLGRQLLAPANDEQVSVFTDWMPRAGDRAVFTAELVTAIDARLTVEVFHKNREDTGPGTSAGTVVSATATTGLHAAEIGSLKELVRYKITVSGTSSTALGAILYRMHPPTWLDVARV